MGQNVPEVAIQLLGPVQATVGRELATLGGPKPRAVLALLALAEGRTVGVDRIAEALWDDDPPARWMATVQVYISGLRKALGPVGPRAVLALRPGYRLDLSVASVDVVTFASMVDEAAACVRDNPVEASDRYRAALALWRGDALADLSRLPGMAALAVGLDAQRIAAEAAAVGVDLCLGRHAALIPSLEAAVAADPLDERRWLHLAVALARSGHQVAALRALGQCRTALRDQLGLEPSRDIASVESAILDHRPIDLFPLRESVTEPSQAAPHTVGDSIPFVGRRDELARMVIAYKAMLDGRAPLVVLAGRAGIGKTRMAEELAARVDAEGAAVGWARCYEAESSAAYRPLVAALGNLVAAEPDAARAAYDPTDPDVALLLPTLDLASEAPARRVEGEEQLRLFDSTAAFLARLAAHRPLVLVIDDLQWLDASSARLVDHLLRHLAADRMLVVMTSRSEDMPTVGPVHELVTTMSRQRQVVSLDVPALSDSDGLTMARAMLGIDASSEWVATVAARSEGVPFFVCELARQVRDDPGGTVELPPGVQSLVRRRLENLAPVAGHLLAILALEPSGVPFEVLRVAADINEAGLLDALDGGLRSGLLTETVDGGDVTIRFSHALYSSSVRGAMAEVRRRHNHVALAEGFASQGKARYLRQHAYHLWAAGRSGDPVRAAEACLAAGDEAFARTAYLAAAADYQRALEAREWAGCDEGDRCGLLLRAAESLHRAGDAEARRELADQAFESSVRAGDAEVMARAALVHGGARSTYGMPSRRTMQMLTAARAALRTPGADEGLIARVSSRLAQEHYHIGERELAREMSADALARARATGDDAVIAATCEGRVWALYTAEDLPERLALTDEMVGRAERAKEPEWEMLARVWRCCALLERGDVAAIDRDLEELARLADLVRVPSHLFRISTMRATRALMGGDFGTGFMLAQETRDIGLPIEPENALQTFAAQVFNMLREQSGLVGAADLIEDIARDFPGATGWMCALAFVNAEAGRLRRTRDLVEALAPDRFSCIQRDLAWIYAMTYLSEAIVAIGAVDHAVTVYELLHPFADRNAGVFDISSNGSVDHYLGMLAATAGRDDEAISHLRAAVRFNDGSSQRPFGARSRVELIRVLVRCGDPGGEVPDLRADVEAAIAELGLSRLAEQLAEIEP